MRLTPLAGFGSRIRSPLHWTLLTVASVLAGFLLDRVGFPAAFLIGPMACAISAAALGVQLKVREVFTTAAQAVLGLLIASAISPAFLPSLADHWRLFLGIVTATLTASSVAGYLISRWKIMPGTSGVWGMAPGASTAMVLMAEAFGADARLVAFMQYLRVVMVSAIAALVAHFLVDVPAVSAPDRGWFPALDLVDFGSTVVVAVVGVMVGRLMGLPSPAFLGVLLVGVALEFPGYVTFQLPPWLLSASYLLIGWMVGLRFTRPILRHVVRVLPQVVLCIVFVIAFCGSLAWFLVATIRVDPLTAYLATSPGGLDTIAILAAASQQVDVSFVMSIQLFRLIAILLFGPMLARFVANLVR